jgi:hypothetical protein
MSDEEEDFALGVETREALDSALYSYMEAVKKALDKHTDEELTAFGGEGEYFRIPYGEFERHQARLEVMYRGLYRRAKPVLDSANFSGAYCFEHDCDARNCREQHGD